MPQARLFKSFAFLFLASGFAGAQVALLAITGKGLGPDEFQQASFPLPTTDGLGSVTVQASVGGTNRLEAENSE